MRVIVIGSREFSERATVFHALTRAYDGWRYRVEEGEERPGTFTLVHGAARGADALADDWACCMNNGGAAVTIERHPAQWDRYGNAAGPIRNRQMMALGADLVLAFFNYESLNRGTTDCVNVAYEQRIEVQHYWSGHRIRDVNLPEGDVTEDGLDEKLQRIRRQRDAT